jgi:hypothetical protein
VLGIAHALCTIEAVFSVTQAVINGQYAKTVQAELDREAAMHGLFMQMRLEERAAARRRRSERSGAAPPRELGVNSDALTRFARAAHESTGRRISNVVSEQQVQSQLQLAQLRRESDAGTAALSVIDTPVGSTLSFGVGGASATFGAPNDVPLEDQNKPTFAQRVYEFDWVPRSRLRKCSRRCEAFFDSTPAIPRWMRAPTQCIVQVR